MLIPHILYGKVNMSIQNDEKNKKSQIEDNLKRSRQRRDLSLTGFTLIEIIVVLAIILLIAGLVTPGLIEGRYRAKVVLTKAEISEMERAIAMYELDYGAYPSDLPDYSSKALVDTLEGDPKSDPPRKPYYTVKKNRIVNNEYVSLFNRHFYYRENASEKTKTDEMKKPFTYDIWTDDCRKNKEGINNWD